MFTETLRWLRPWAALIAIPLIISAVFYGAPVLGLLRLSLAHFDPLIGVAHGFQIDTYMALLSDEYFLEIVWRTIRLSLLTTLACAVFGFPVSMVVAQAKGWAQTGLFIVLLLPLMTSVTVTTYGWLILLGQSGFVNNQLLALGLITRPLRMLQTEAAIVVGLTHVLCVFMVISVAAALRGIDPNHIRAARSLGASPWASFRHIVLPQSLPGLRTGSLLVFSLSMSSYATPGVLGGPRLKFVSFLIYQQAIQLLIVTTGVLALGSAYGQVRTWRRHRTGRVTASGTASFDRQEIA